MRRKGTLPSAPGLATRGSHGAPRGSGRIRTAPAAALALLVLAALALGLEGPVGLAGHAALGERRPRRPSLRASLLYRVKARLELVMSGPAGKLTERTKLVLRGGG